MKKQLLTLMVLVSFAAPVVAEEACCGTVETQAPVIETASQVTAEVTEQKPAEQAPEISEEELQKLIKELMAQQPTDLQEAPAEMPVEAPVA